MRVVRTGNCFYDAATKLMREPDWTMVHGAPLGTGGHAAGLRYSHAWLEKGPIVWDPCADLEVGKELYYALGNIDRRETYRYDLAEANKMMLKTGVYGPWAETLVSLEDKLEKL